MTDAQLYGAWFVALGIAAVVIVIAAVLLIAILLVARSIRSHAVSALESVQAIADDTAVIPGLATTNAVAGEILMTAESIELHGAEVVSVLHHAAPPTAQRSEKTHAE